MVNHQFANVNGIKLHYVTTGQGELMLFVHGFPEFWYAWRKQLATFGADFQAVAVDMRGYNLSDKPAEVAAYSIKHLVEDLRALVDHLGRQKFTLVAHDWGGVVGWAFAARWPNYLHKLIIINAPHPTIFARELRHNPAQQKASQYIDFFRSAQAEAVLSANDYAHLKEIVLAHGLKQGYFTEADSQAYLSAWSQPGALTGGLNYYRAFSLSPSNVATEPASPKPNALKITVPTLVIWGEQDTALLTGNLVGLAEVVSDLTVKRISQGSHWVIHQYPDLVDQTIKEFLAV